MLGVEEIYLCWVLERYMLAQMAETAIDADVNKNFVFYVRSDNDELEL